MGKFSEKEVDLFQFMMLIVGSLIEQGAIDRPALKVFLEKRLEDQTALQPDDGLNLLLQQASAALDKWGNDKAYILQ